jgi:hypothetical protein
LNPTPRLRFVERDSYSRNGEHFSTPHKVRILQQWFAYDIDYPATKGEWKDVPTLEEKDVKTF